MAERTKVRERTRHAILRAGIDVLSNDPSAPLGEVAARADVARSTLHRYYPDRRELAVAIATYVNQQYDEAVDRGLQGGSSGLEQFRRLCVELTERLDILVWWMNPGAAALCEGTEAAPDDEPDVRIMEVVNRGHLDGSIDRQIGSEWTESLLWATLYAIRMTQVEGAEAFDLRNQAVRTLLKALAADPAAV